MQRLFLFLVIFYTPLEALIKGSFKNSQIDLSSANASLNLAETIDFGGKVSFDNRAKLSGNPIIITNGSFENKLADLGTGTFLFAESRGLSSVIFIDGGQSFFCNSLANPINLVVRGAGAKVFFSNSSVSGDLALVDETCSVLLASKAPVKLNLFLNGGSVTLQDNLRLDSGSQIWGPGTIVFNGYNIELREVTINTGLNFSGQGKALFLGRSFVAGTLNFDVPGGSGVEVSGGTVKFEQNGRSGLFFYGTGTAEVSAIDLLGVGANSSMGGEIASSIPIYFDGATLSLATSFTQSSNFQFRNSPSLILTNSYTWAVTGGLIINDTTLFCDRLSQAQPSSIITYGAGTISNLGLGRIAPMAALNGDVGRPGQSGACAVGFPNSVTVNVGNFRQGDPRQLRSAAAMSFSTTVTYDALNADFTFPLNTAKVWAFTAANNTTLTVLNAKLARYKETNVNFRTGSQIVFGDGCQIILGEDRTLATADRDWRFSGNTGIDGRGNALFVNGLESIFVQNGGTLTIKNCNLYPGAVNCIFLAGDTSRLILQDVNLYIPIGGYAFGQGNLVFRGDCKLFNFGAFVGSTINSFSFNSSGSISIEEWSRLTLSRDVYFRYNPNFKKNPSNANFANFLMADSSYLVSDGATLETTATGASFSGGTFFVRDNATIVVPQAETGSICFGSDCRILFDAGAELKLFGQVRLS